MAPVRIQHTFEEIPHPGVSYGQNLFNRLQELSRSCQQPCQIFRKTNESLSFSEFLLLSVRTARGLRLVGLRCGDTLAVYSRNTADLIYSVAGAVFEGITLALINPVSTNEELHHYLSLVKPRAMVSEPGFNSNRALAVAAPGTLHLVTGEDPVDGALTLQKLRSLGEGEDPERYKPAHIEDWEDHIVFIQFSSGTGGLSKAVAYSDVMAVLHSADPRCFIGIVPNQRLLVTSWLSWISGTTLNFVALLRGTTRILDNFESPQDVVDVMVQYKINHWFIAPPVLLLVAEAVKKMSPRPDLSSLRGLITGGGALAADTHRFIMEALGVPVRQLYGCTELGIVSGDVYPPRPGSSGVPVPGVRLRLVDVTTGKDVEWSSAPGEIRVSSQVCFKHYVDNPEATRAAFDEQGFYRTGDLAFWDADGHLHVVDRIKELLKYNSWEMAPAEIESVLLTHPAVMEACVVGTPHPKAGDLPTAFVVARPGATVSEETLQKLVEARLSDFKRLRGGVFFEEQPLIKNVNGKIDRKPYKERVSRGINSVST